MASAFGGVRTKAKSPEKGVFPLDHFAECKEVGTEDSMYQCAWTAGWYLRGVPERCRWALGGTISRPFVATLLPACNEYVAQGSVQTLLSPQCCPASRA